MSTNRLRRCAPRCRSGRGRPSSRPHSCPLCGGRQGFCCCQFLLWAQQVVISDPCPPRLDRSNPPRLDFSMVYDHHEISMRPLIFDRPTIDLSKISTILKSCFPVGSQCAVCLDALEYTSSTIASICGGLSSDTHYFHGDCLAESTRHVWENDLHSKCPLCRAVLIQENLRLVNKLKATTDKVSTGRQESVEMLSSGNMMRLVKEMCRIFNKSKNKLCLAKPKISIFAKSSTTELKVNVKATDTSQRETHNRNYSSKLTERLIHDQLLHLRTAGEIRRERKKERKQKKKDKKLPHRPHRRRRGKNRRSNADGNEP